MTSPNNGYPIRAFLICLIAYTLSQMDLALFIYALPAIRRDWNKSIQQMSFVASIAFLINAALIVWLGLLTDRIGRKTMFQISVAVSACLVALHFFAPNTVVLTILRGLSLAAGGLLYPVTGAIIAEEAPARFRGLIGGLLQTGYPLGWGIGGLLAANVLQQYGWRYVFLIGLLSLPVVLLARFFLRETKRFTENKAQRTSHAKLSELFTPALRKRTAALFLGQFLFVIAYSGSAFLLPTYLHEARGFSLSDATLLVGKANVIGAIGYVLASITGEFVMTRRNTIVVWALLGSLAFLGLIWLTSSWTTVIVAYSLMVMFFYGTAAVKFVFIGEHFPTRLRATGLAFCGAFAVTLGTALGQIVLSYAVKSFGWNRAFTFVIGIPLFLSGLVFLLLRPMPSGLEVEQVAGN